MNNLRRKDMTNKLVKNPDNDNYFLMLIVLLILLLLSYSDFLN